MVSQAVPGTVWCHLLRYGALIRKLWDEGKTFLCWLQRKWSCSNKTRVGTMQVLLRIALISTIYWRGLSAHGLTFWSLSYNWESWQHHSSRSVEVGIPSKAQRASCSRSVSGTTHARAWGMTLPPSAQTEWCDYILQKHEDVKGIQSASA